MDPEEARWAASHEASDSPTTPGEASFAGATGEPKADPFVAPDTERTDRSDAAAVEPGRNAHPSVWDTVDTNTLAVTLLVVVTILASLTFIGQLAYEHFISEPEATAVEAPAAIPPVLSGSNVQPISLTPENLEELPNLIAQAATSAPNGLTEFPVVSPMGEEVSPSYIFELLRFQTVPSLRQSLTTLRFANLDQASPALVLQYVDRETVRGGMLTWENNLREDLRVIYPRLAANSNVAERFTDRTLAARDVRVLTNNDGEVLIVYGFVGSNSLILAPSETTFTELIELGFAE
jgi:hypothetical protein